MLSSISLATTLALLSTADAHFNLNAPPSIGFDEDNEGIAPCGGFTPDFSKNVTDFHVGGEPVATFLGHPQGNWLYRATLDQKAGGNWTQLFPIVQQSGLGAFCEPSIAVNPSWAGKQGILGVVVDTQDGILYQCATVNFVAGTGTVSSTTCNNATVQASFVSDSQLSALVGGSSSGNSTTAPTNTGTSTTSASAAATSTKNAAPGLVRGDVSFGGVIIAAAMALLGAALL